MVSLNHHDNGAIWQMEFHWVGRSVPGSRRAVPRALGGGEPVPPRAVDICVVQIFLHPWPDYVNSNHSNRRPSVFFWGKGGDKIQIQRVPQLKPFRSDIWGISKCIPRLRLSGQAPWWDISWAWWNRGGSVNRPAPFVGRLRFETFWDINPP